MKARVYLILLCLCVCFRMNAQPGLDHYDYDICYFVDNLPQIPQKDTVGFDGILVPSVIDSIYYSRLKYNTKFKLFNVIDTLHKRIELHFRSKKARAGYLFVNRAVADFFADSISGMDRALVVYVYDNQVVSTKKDVKRLLRLREKRISITGIKPDEQAGTITVYVQRNREGRYAQ